MDNEILQKRKVYAIMLFPNWVGANLPNDILIMLNSAFSLEEALSGAFNALTLSGKNPDLYAASKWVAVEYDKLVGKSDASPPIILQPAVALEKRSLVISYLLNESNATTEEKTVVEGLMKRVEEKLVKTNL